MQLSAIEGLISGLGLTAQAYEVDASKSKFIWTGKKVTGKHYGTLPLKSSKVKSEGDKITGGEFVLDISKMTVTDLSGEWATKFLTHIKSADFFEVEKWPTAKLVVKSLDGKKAKGDLTIKGKTNPVEFAYSKKGEMFQGTLTFDRTKFGMIYGSGNFFKGLGDKTIYNDVTLDFQVKLNTNGKKLAQQ